MKKLIPILVILLITFFTGMAGAGTTVTLGWSPNSEPDLAGYRVYQDGILQKPDVLCPANNESCCTWKSAELIEGNHEWYVTAFDESKNESGPSNTVSYFVDLTSPGSPQNITITINITIGLPK